MNTPVVLITGALTGIGRATAVAFAREGARVVVSGRRDDAGHALARQLRELGAEAEFVHADVREDDNVRGLVDKTVAKFGRLDVAVNNAGTEGTSGPVTEQTADSYAAIFDTNVLGTLLSMKHELRVAGPRPCSIINLSSTVGERGAAGASGLHRQQARGGRTGRSAARSKVRFGVRVNAGSPGASRDGNASTGSRAMPTGKPLDCGRSAQARGRAREIAQAIVYPRRRKRRS